jgi:hypothetical protein
MSEIKAPINQKPMNKKALSVQRSSSRLPLLKIKIGIEAVNKISGPYNIPPV